MNLDITQYKISEDIIKRENEVSMFRRGDLDHNIELQKHLQFYKDKVEEFLNKCPYENINNKLIAGFEKFCRDYTDAMSKYLNHRANNPSWAVTGRGGLNKAKYDKAQDRQDALISNLNTADEMMNKRLRVARLDFEKLSKQDEKESIANLVATKELPKFTTKEVMIQGEGLKRGTSLGGYVILKNWGTFRIYAPSGKEIHSMKTNETQKQAKEWLFYYLDKHGLLNNAQEESTNAKKMKKTATKTIREDGDFRLVERDGGYTIQNHSTGKWLVYKESSFGSFSKLDEKRAKMYYTYIMLVGGYMTFKRHEVTDDMYNKKYAELFGDKEPVKTDNDVKTENPQPKDVEKEKPVNDSFVSMFKTVTKIDPQVSSLGVISVKVKEGHASKKLAVNSRTLMAIVGIPWEDDIASFNIFCKDSELFAAMKKHGFTMTVARQNSENEFMFSMKVGHKASIGNWDTNVVNVDENIIREFWGKVTRAAEEANQLVAAYKSVSLDQKELYHLSPKENEDAILKDGILSTLSGQRTGDAVPGAVYVVNDIDALLSAIPSFNKGEYSVFKINGNYTLKPDFYEPSLAGISFYIRNSIDPEDLELIGRVNDGVKANIDVEEVGMEPIDILVKDVGLLSEIDNLVFEITGNNIDIHFKEQMNTVQTIDAKEYGIDIVNLDEIMKQLKDRVPHIQLFKDNRNRDVNSVKDLITIDEIDAQFYDIQDIVELEGKYQIVYQDNEDIKAYMNVNLNGPQGEFVVDFKIIKDNLNSPHFNKLKCMEKVIKETILSDINGCTLSAKHNMYDDLQEGTTVVLNDIKRSWINFKGVVDDIQQFIDEDRRILENPELYKVNLEDLAYRVIGIRPSRVNKAGSVQYDDLPTGNDKFEGKMKISDKKVIASFHTRFTEEELGIVNQEHLSTLKALGYESKGTDFYTTRNVKDIEKELPDIWEDFNNAITVMNDVSDNIIEKSVEIEPELRHQEYKIETSGCSLFIKASSIGDSQAVIDTMEIKDSEGKVVVSAFGINSYLSMVQDREDELRRFLEHDYWKVVSEFIETGRGNKLLVAKVELDKELAIKEKEAYWNDIRQQIEVKNEEVDREKDNAIVVFNTSETRARILIPIGPLGPSAKAQAEDVLKMFELPISKIQEGLAHMGNVHELEGLPMANEPKWRPHGVQTATVDLLDKVIAYLKANKQAPVNQPKEVDVKDVEEVRNPENQFGKFKDTSIKDDNIQLAIAPQAGGSRMYRIEVLNKEHERTIQDFLINKLGYFRGEDGLIYKEVFTHDNSENHILQQAMIELNNVLNPAPVENTALKNPQNEDELRQTLTKMKTNDLKQMLMDLGVAAPKGTKAVLIDQVLSMMKAMTPENPIPEPKPVDVPKQTAKKAETAPKLALVSNRQQKLQLKRLQTIAKKFADVIDQDPDVNLVFLEEPTELKKYKLPVPCMALISYDMEASRQELEKIHAFKLLKNARGTKCLGNWFKSTDSEGVPCRLCLFLDKDFEKASDINRNAVDRLYRKYKVMESIGQTLLVCGEELLLESYDFNTAVFSYEGIRITLKDSEMHLYESTQCENVCVDCKKDDMVKKVIKARKLELKKED